MPKLLGNITFDCQDLFVVIYIMSSSNLYAESLNGFEREAECTDNCMYSST
jgi:hypothetical protein